MAGGGAGFAFGETFGAAFAAALMTADLDDLPFFGDALAANAAFAPDLGFFDAAFATTSPRSFRTDAYGMAQTTRPTLLSDRKDRQL